MVAIIAEAQEGAEITAKGYGGEDKLSTCVPRMWSPGSQWCPTTKEVSRVESAMTKLCTPHNVHKISTSWIKHINIL
jgi:hypothetical protein